MWYSCIQNGHVGGHMNQSTEERLISILKRELIPAMGCTEPIAIALAAAKAREVLGVEPKKICVGCSSNIIKNVKSVTIPGTHGLHGIEAAAVAGAFAGKPGAGMQVLAEVTEARKDLISERLKEGICSSYHLKTDHALHIRVEMCSGEENTVAEICDDHDNFVLLEKNGRVLMDRREDCSKFGKEELQEEAGILKLSVIREFADTVDIGKIRPILEKQIACNMAIAEEGMHGGYGLYYASALLDEHSTVYDRMEAYAASGSEARMSGCAMPVIINSGSGTQGITSSVPAIIYCREKGYSEEKLFRVLAFSNLVTVAQKQYIGKLSAFCGAISAACASGAALTYAEGGTLEQICDTVSNTLAVAAGIICDGAKPSCGAKIAIGLHAAINAHKLAMKNRSYQPGEGIVCQDADTTIKEVGRIAKDGMEQTDAEIISVMLENL